MPVKFSDLNLPPTPVILLGGNSISLVITLAIKKQEVFWESVNFVIVHITEANVQLTEKFVIIFIVYNKKNYFNVYSQRVGKIVYEIERDESDDRFY